MAATIANTHGKLCPKVGQNFYVDMKMMDADADWLPETSSEEFKQVQEQISACMKATYAGSNEYRDVKVLNLITGNAGFVIRFKAEGANHLDRLQNVVATGEFCDMKVDTNLQECMKLIEE